MEALITSCGRYDLLFKTLESFHKNQSQNVFINIHEDGLSKIGQHDSIEKYLNRFGEKYYLHCEEDWMFVNSYDWIKKSIEIMEADNSIIKVLCRGGSPHPCTHDQDGFGFVNTWTGEDGILWHGFSWNPGVTRADLLKQFIPFAKTEQEVAEQIYKAGYKVVELEKYICTHIGEGRSTH
jgi:hypothetical protein